MINNDNFYGVEIEFLADVLRPRFDPLLGKISETLFRYFNAGMFWKI